MLAPLTAWKDVIRIVPHSGVQFVDYAFNIDNTPRFSRPFLERSEGEKRADGTVPVRLHPMWNEDDPDKPPELSPRADDQQYEINKQRALEPFLDKWVPVPYLRMKPGRGPLGQEMLDTGPTNWARVRVVQLPEREGDARHSHRVVFSFDTELVERRPNRPYTGPSADDAKDEQEFRFAYRVRDIAWFLSDAAPPGATVEAGDNQDWVNSWLQELFFEYKQAQRPGRPLRPEDMPYHLEHWSRYIAFLEVIETAVHPAKIKLIDTVSRDPRDKPVMVDFVLDIGNSRTCGILIESYPNEKGIDLNNSIVLQLRDLSRPENVHNEPFESSIELSQAGFGKDHFSRRSTRARAFFWPSLLRVGVEATRFRGAAEGTEAATGMSSPKRYLWDEAPVNQEWRFQPGDYTADGTGPLIERTIRRFVTSKGDVIRQLEVEEQRYRKRLRAEDKATAARLTFSRSSMFGFMFCEILWQAIVMINDAAVRARRRYTDAPRRLRRVIVTVPPATPLQEQRILRSRAEGAIRLLWDLMDWTTNRPPNMDEPRINIEWDEASCIHFVYLFGEITQKFGGAATDFFRLMGKPRPFAEPEQQPKPGQAPEPSLRIASIDVGGGTTDLMISTYYIEENRAIKPVQNFREGFRIAGDDILKGVVERLVLQPIEARLVECGLRGGRELLKTLFGGNRADTAEQERHLRRQFVLRVFAPIALAMLHDYEEADPTDEEIAVARPFADFFPSNRIPDRIAAFIERPARDAGAVGFSLESCSFPIDFQAMRDIVRNVVGRIMDNLAEAVHHYDCDLVLLSGRPSRLPPFVELVVEKLAVTPDRVLPLHEYRAGIWYPFRSRDNVRIEDPKTAAAVGGMLCALAERQLHNFTLYTNRLAMRSTAKYIGELELSGQLLDERLIFRNVDLDKSAQQAPAEAKVRYYAPMRLGFRQLPLERWAASPLYRLEMRNPQNLDRMKRPITVTLERPVAEIDDEASVEEVRRAQVMKEEFVVTEVEDAEGNTHKRDLLELSLDTLAVDEGYWLDTGILSIP